MKEEMKYNYAILITLQVTAIYIIYLLLDVYLGYYALFVAILYGVLAYIPMIIEARRKENEIRKGSNKTIG